VDSLRYEYESKKAEEDPRTAGIKAELDRTVAEMDEDRQKLLASEQEVAAIKERIAGMTAARDAAEKQQEDLLALHTRLEEKNAKTRPNVWTLARNAPFLDFTAPTQKITQVVISDLKNDVNFMEIARIDRCVTCHVGINRAGFEDQANPYKTHPRMDLFVG